MNPNATIVMPMKVGSKQREAGEEEPEHGGKREAPGGFSSGQSLLGNISTPSKRCEPRESIL